MYAAIIDDSPVTRSILSVLLKECGVIPIECEGADAAIDLLHRRKEIRVVLVDWQIPGGGCELVRRIRRDVAICDKRIVLVATETDIDDLISGIEAGIDDYLTKPFSPVALREKMDLLGVMAA